MINKYKMADQDVSKLASYLPWEEDIEMVSKYLDRKVCIN